MNVENNENIDNNDIVIINKNINNFLDNHNNIKQYLSNYNKNEEICIICLEPYDFKKDDQILKYNHCGYLYIHEICLYNWFNVKDECLLCKKQLIDREENIETQSQEHIEQQIVPRFNNMFMVNHNIHRFFINNYRNNYRNNYDNYENRLINYYSNNNNENIRDTNDINDINDTNNMNNNQLIIVQNELIFHINNNVSRRNFSIFLICFKFLYFIPPIIILCAIYELNNYFD